MGEWCKTMGSERRQKDMPCHWVLIIVLRAQSRQVLNVHHWIPYLLPVQSSPNPGATCSLVATEAPATAFRGQRMILCKCCLLSWWCWGCCASTEPAKDWAAQEWKDDYSTDRLCQAWHGSPTSPLSEILSLPFLFYIFSLIIKYIDILNNKIHGYFRTYSKSVSWLHTFFSLPNITLNKLYLQQPFLYYSFNSPSYYVFTNSSHQIKSLFFLIGRKSISDFQLFTKVFTDFSFSKIRILSISAKSKTFIHHSLIESISGPPFPTITAPTSLSIPFRLLQDPGSLDHMLTEPRMHAWVWGNRERGTSIDPWVM